MKIVLEAGEDKTVQKNGYGFYVIDSIGPVEVELREHNGQVDQSAELLAGQGLRGSNRFDQFRIKNLHHKKQVLTVYTGVRQFIDNRNVGDFTVQIRQGAGVKVDAKTITGVEMIAVGADPDRLKLVVENRHATESVKISTSVDVLIKGLTISPGEKLVIDRAAAGEFWMIAAGAVDVPVTIWEEIDTFKAPLIDDDVLTTNNGAPLYTESGELIEEG